MSERGEVERVEEEESKREREREREVTTTLSAALLPYIDNTTHAQMYDDVSFPKSQTVFKHHSPYLHLQESLVPWLKTEQRQ